MTNANLALLRRRLLTWYRKNQRDLPWRRMRDPYAIWVSETMLQQTQVKTVIPYFNRFMTSFPDIHALSRAPLQRVLRLWSGLGYYRRAENLHRAARLVVAQHGASLPHQYDQLRALPGVGDYTAGALLSIAFGKKYSAVDGNVRRLLTRLLDKRSNREIHIAAAALAVTSQPGIVNQALMELGATICTAKEPKCDTCPVATACASRKRRHGTPANRPQKNLMARAVTWPLAVVHSHGKILLRRRQNDGLLAKLWELPGRESTPTANAEVILRQQLKPLSINGLVPRQIGALRHSITNRRIIAPILLYRLPENHQQPKVPPQWRWVEPSELHRFATSSMTVKAVNLFLSHEKNPT